MDGSILEFRAYGACLLFYRYQLMEEVLHEQLCHQDSTHWCFVGTTMSFVDINMYSHNIYP